MYIISAKWVMCVPSCVCRAVIAIHNRSKIKSLGRKLSSWRAPRQDGLVVCPKLRGLWVRIPPRTKLSGVSDFTKYRNYPVYQSFWEPVLSRLSTWPSRSKVLVSNYYLAALLGEMAYSGLSKDQEGCEFESQPGPNSGVSDFTKYEMNVD